MLDGCERHFDPGFVPEERPDHISCQGKELFAEAPGGSTRPVMLKGEKEKKKSSKEPEIEIRKRNAVFPLAEQLGPGGLEAIIEGDSRRYPDRLLQEREFAGDVMTLGQRVIVQYQAVVEGGGEEELAPIHHQEEFGFLSPAPELFDGDSRLFGDPGKRGFPQVSLHQGSAILGKSERDLSSSQLRGPGSVDILLQPLLEPLLIEK